MQKLSTTYEELFNTAHIDEVKVEVYDSAGATLQGTLGMSELLSLSTTNELYNSETPTFGSCVAGEIELTTYADEFKIPQMAMLKPFIRIVNGTQRSEWVPQGIYYVDTREKASGLGAIKITGYDAMLKTEGLNGATYAELTAFTEWPQKDAAVVNEICGIMGVELDSRSVLNENYDIGYPNDYSMREILGFVAVSYGGNWTITETGKLRLVPFEGNSDTVDIGENASSFTSGDAMQKVSKVTLLLDDGNGYAAGDDTGTTLEIKMPWATQTMANNLLASVRDYIYQPFEATNALLDFAVEMGDTLETNGFTTQLCRKNAKYGAFCLADIGAPYEEEVNSEYPYATKAEKEAERKVALGVPYNNVVIDKVNGITVTHYTDEKADAIARLNGKELAFYAGNEPKDENKMIYFDPTTKRYMFKGDVFVDGNINMANGTITWGDNDPSGLDEEEVKAIIKEDLVSAPIIAGGVFKSGSQSSWLVLSDGVEYSEDEYGDKTSSGGTGLFYGVDQYGTGEINQGDVFVGIEREWGEGIDESWITFLGQRVLERAGYGEFRVLTDIALTQKIVLEEWENYGIEFPENPKKGQLFFLIES